MHGNSPPVRECWIENLAQIKILSFFVVRGST
jgi:hypothetical protein